MGVESGVSVKFEPGELRLPPGPGVNLLATVLKQKKWVDPIAHFTQLAEHYGDIVHYRLGRRHIGRAAALRHDGRHAVVAEPLFTLRPNNEMPMWVEAR